MNRRFVLLAALLLALLVAGTLVLWPRGTADAESPPLAGATIGGPFNLVDQNGQPYGDRNLKGHYALVYFGYSYCPDVCRSEEHTSELQSLMRISYAVFCLKKKKTIKHRDIIDCTSQLLSLI